MKSEGPGYQHESFAFLSDLHPKTTATTKDHFLLYFFFFILYFDWYLLMCTLSVMTA